MKPEDFELIEPLYAKEGFIPTRKFRRRESSDGRLYLSETEFGVWNAYRSVTTALQMSYPQSPYLTQWQTNQGGYEGYLYTLNSAADYGTFMHACIVRFILSACVLKLTIISVEELISDELNQFKLRGGYIIKDDWKSKALNDLYAFAKFYIEKNVVVLGLEVVTGTDNYLAGRSEISAPLAGAIDMVCEMDFNKGRVMAIVDFKSGRKGFYESHVRQLGIYKNIWNESYPQLSVDKIFNWRPNDWRGDKPTYTLENQTDKVDYKSIDLRLAASFHDDPITLPQNRIYLPIEIGQPVENFVTLKEFGQWD